MIVNRTSRISIDLFHRNEKCSYRNSHPSQVRFANFGSCHFGKFQTLLIPVVPLLDLAAAEEEEDHVRHEENAERDPEDDPPLG